MLATVLAVLLTGCAAGAGGSGAPASAEPTRVLTPPPVRIGPDGPEPPDREGLIAYGNEHADQFGGMYIDPPGGTRVIMLFTGDLEEHQRAVDEILPGTQVRQARFTEAALVELLESLDFEALEADGIEMVSAGLDTIGNKVTLEVKSNDPTVELRLELQYGGMLDVTVYPMPGEWANVTEGDGWRLVATGEASGAEAYTVRAARNAEEWVEVWDALALPSLDAPTIDFADEVVVSFAHGIGSGCREMRLDGVEVENGLVFSQTSDPLAPRACTSDLRAAVVFIVALDRDALPDDGFTLRLSRELLTGPGAGFTEEIDVALP